jgi:hypothetical protein
MITENEVNVIQPIPSQGDGFLAIGSAQDTLATVYGMPKVRKDYKKIARNQGQLLRGKAVMVTNSPVDMTREFFITFYLEDDTVQVFEEVKRNSGIWGGSFLKRGNYMQELPTDADEPRPVYPSDMYLGNILCLNGCQFRLVEMDNMTLRFCENNPNEFPWADIRRICGEILHQVHETKLDLKALFITQDGKKTMNLMTEKFVDLLEGQGLTEPLNDQEILTLLRRFSDDGGSAILNNKNPNSQMVSATAGDVVFYPEFMDFLSHLYYMYQVRGRVHNSSLSTSVFGQFLANARSRTVQWRRVFRKDPTVAAAGSSQGTLQASLLHVMKVFQKNGMTLTESVVQEIANRYTVNGASNNSGSNKVSSFSRRFLYF